MEKQNWNGIFLSIGLAITVFLSALQSAGAAEDSSLSADEIRSMQSRKFFKGTVEIVNKIQTSSVDSAKRQCAFQEVVNREPKSTLGTCYLSTDPYNPTPASLSASIPFIGGLISSALQGIATQVTNSQLKTINYYLDASRIDNNITIVRLRIYDLKNTQIFEREVYEKEFIHLSELLATQPNTITVDD